LRVHLPESFGPTASAPIGLPCTASSLPPWPCSRSSSRARHPLALPRRPRFASFRPQDALTAGELATVVASLGGAISVDDPYRPVTVRELDARLVSLLGLRSAALQIRLAALNAGLSPKPSLGTETVARMLGLRVNHERESEKLELQLTQPATRAEAAYSVARVLALTAEELTAARETAATFAVPYLTDLERAVLERALAFVVR
jgi:hypothetical protein